MTAEPETASHTGATSPFTSAVPDFAARMAAAEGISTKREAIIRAALSMFAELGYQATSLRKLADRVGIEAGSLYNHISSKNDLLSDMVVFATGEVLTGVRELIATAPADAVARLRLAITAHVQFHCIQREQVLVLDRETRALSGENAENVLRARAEYEHLFHEIIQDGVDSGALRPHDVSLSTKAILRMGPGTATWFKPDGPSTAREVGEFYAGLFVDGLVTRPT
jgi:TetR/AcrR family transcriptional regulator, cholesterol catabolism regulator